MKDRIKQLYPLIDKNGDHFLDDAELRAWTLGNGAEPDSPCLDARLDSAAWVGLPMYYEAAKPHNGSTILDANL